MTENITAYGEFIRGYRDMRRQMVTRRGQPLWLARERIMRTYDATTRRNETTGVTVSGMMRTAELDSYERGLVAAYGMNSLERYPKTFDESFGHLTKYPETPLGCFHLGIAALNKTGNLWTSRTLKQEVQDKLR